MKLSTKLSVILTIAALGLSFATLAAAQSDALANLYMSAGNVPTNIAGIRTFAEPPKGFNPVAATAEELATYGFPPRPDKYADPDHYSLWERAMLAAKIRVTGELKPMPARMHGMMPAGLLSQQVVPQVLTGPKRLSTINGSGVFLTNYGIKKWSSTASFNDIWTVISVPVATQPFDNTIGCTASDYLSVSFAGIDSRLAFLQPGWVVLPELQGGVVSDYNCVYGTTAYYAYAQWGSSVAPFNLNPGDLFYTEVHCVQPNAAACVFLEDLRTLTYGSYMVDPDPSVPLVGNSAQWVVSRPCCSGPNPIGAYPLANTIAISFDGATAQNRSGKLFYPGSQASSTYVLTMMDDGSTQNIEVVNQGNTGYQGLHSLWFQTTGCAYTGGCTP